MPHTQYFVVVDLHKSVIQIRVLDAEERHRVETLDLGLALVAHLSQWSPARFAVEAVGLNRWFVNACQERGYDIVVVDAARLNLRSCGKKNDRRDAHEIARRLRLGDLDRFAKTTIRPTRCMHCVSSSGSGTTSSGSART